MPSTYSSPIAQDISTGFPIAWARFHGVDALHELCEPRCAYRFDYLYGDGEIFAEVCNSTNYTANYEKIEDPDSYFSDWTAQLEGDEALFFDDNLLVISDGQWVSEFCFPDPTAWLNKETYTSRKEEIDAWSEWKRQAYRDLCEN